MRRFIVGFLLVAAAVTTSALSGCPAAHNEYPGSACKTNSDCYQGEICSDSVCVPNTDFAVISDFAHPPLDFSMGDLLPGADDMTPVDL